MPDERAPWFCVSCAHWGENHNAVDGTCGRITEGLDDIAYLDVQCLEAPWLVTRFDFGCSLWKSREKEEPHAD